MSYYGEEITDENERLIAVGDREVSSLTDSQREYIAGMQRIYDCIADEKMDYEDNGTVIDRMTNEIAFDALDFFKERIMSEMVEAVVTFTDENAEWAQDATQS